jgi:putative ABC transport system permease protein
MIRNYFMIALRSLGRSRVHSTINILGLSLGIACCLLILLFIRDEWTYDAFHTKADRIYRVYAREDWGENQQFFNTVTPFPMGPALKDNFPEVEQQVRFNKFGAQVKIGAEQFTELIAVGGKDFFKVFDFKIAAGNDQNTFSGQSDVVITATTAQKYFGAADPVGKAVSIQLGETFEEFVVTAVTDPIPANSSIQFTLLISDLNYPKLFPAQVLTSAWFNINPETYILLKQGATAADVERKFPSVFRTILGDENYSKSKYAPGLQPLESIHLDTAYPVGIAPVSDPKYSYILGAIALLLLLVACINFVTLSVGRSIQRAKEVGIRKVVGAMRRQLIIQFIGEAVLVTVASLILGISLAAVALPFFNDLAGKSLTIVPDTFLLTIALLMVAVIGLMAGSYPALVLSNFKPIEILKGRMQSGGSKQALRKALVGFQLVLSIFLISSTLVMRKQLQFLQNKNLGFNREQLAVLEINVSRKGRLTERIRAGFEKTEQFKVELSSIPEVMAVAGASHDFANGRWTAIGYTDDKGIYRNFNINIVDADYIPTMKMEMTKGRNFSAENTSDTRRSIIVNEAFVKVYGWPDPIGKRIPGKNFQDHEIIGVVQDFNYASLYTKVEPLVMAMDPAIPLSGSENINIDNSPIPKLFVRLRPGNLTVAIDELKSAWTKLATGEQFTFSFVDQALADQYRSDQNLGRIVTTATALAIIIGSLGLYALASLAMQNRTKEISIRKVLGATDPSLLVLLSKDYIYLTGISLVLSVPVTWMLMNRWLESFEYRVPVGWDVFVMAGVLSFLVAIFTISFQAIKTAWTSPAEMLKYE